MQDKIKIRIIEKDLWYDIGEEYVVSKDCGQLYEVINPLKSGLHFIWKKHCLVLT